MHYIKQKRGEFDNCNVCGQFGRLTWDHVPPKSVKIADGAYSNTLFSDEGMPRENKHMKRYQNGIKYRSICEKCNNTLIGQYDVEYANFIQQVNEKMVMFAEKSSNREDFVALSYIDVETKINKVLRSIVGHILSMKGFYETEVIDDQLMRDYLMNDSAEMTEIKIYSWFYPYSTIVNARDVVVVGHAETHPTGVVSIMNAYPLAYLESTECQDACCLDDLSGFSTSDVEDVVNVRLHFVSAYYSQASHIDNQSFRMVRKSFVWPVNISDDVYGAMFALGNDRTMEGSTVAIQK